jgi:uncharacterized protein
VQPCSGCRREGKRAFEKPILRPSDAGEQNLIEYQSAFPIKVMGTAVEGRLRAGRARGDAALRSRLRRRDDRAPAQLQRQVRGIKITATATSREQLDELYRTLSTHPMVKVVLQPGPVAGARPSPKVTISGY